MKSYPLIIDISCSTKKNRLTWFGDGVLKQEILEISTQPDF
jgi:hypothetical protein